MAQIHSNQEMFASVGRALAQWSNIEMGLCRLFIIVSDWDLVEKARGMFDGIISFEIRLSILNQMMELEDVEKLEAETWRRMSIRLSKLYKKRHELAHFSLVLGPQGYRLSPFGTLDKFYTGRAKFLDEHQIAEREERFAQIWEAVNWFVRQAELRREPAGTNRGQPIKPQAIAQLEETARQILEEGQPPPESERG